MSSRDRHDDPMMVLTGDPAAADLLRNNLGQLARQQGDNPMGRLIGAVLEGRRPVHDLVEDAEFVDLMRQGTRRYEEHMASLSPEERQRLVREAERLVDGPE